MYKCKECGQEYDVKPDYCDCGNDEFESVTIKEQQNDVINGGNKEGIDVLYGNTQKTYISEEGIEDTSDVESILSETSVAANRQIISVDPISIIIFVVCILLSIYVLFFAWNPSQQEINSTTEAGKQVTMNVKDIPQINKIWDDSLPVVKQQEQPPKETKIEIPVITPVQNVIKKNVVPKTSSVPKAVNKTKTSQSTQKTTSKSNNTQKTTSQIKNSTPNVTKTDNSAELKAAEEAQLKKLKAEQEKKLAEQKAAQAKVAQQELVTYKYNLRNTIGRKIDFTRVIGDGSCTVSFRIDSSGKLINRSFTKQSSNNTLNDAVYNAVMAVPTFNPPPSAYKNELLNLNIKFSNGNFEISLP